MKTKNIILSIVCVLLSLPFCSAQKGVFEGTFDLGYGFMASPQSGLAVPTSGSTYVYANNITTTSATDVPYSFGTGLNIGLSGTYFLGNHIGAGLDLSYLAGSPTTFMLDEGSGIQATILATGNLFAITPMLTLSANTENINPYGKFGIILGIPSATLSMTEAGTGSLSGTYIANFTGNVAVGWYAAFGLQFPLSSNAALDVELFDRTLAWEPGQMQNTQTFDGQTKDPTVTFTHTVDQSSTNQAIYNFYPFSSAGIKVGITMKFGSK